MERFFSFLLALLLGGPFPTQETEAPPLTYERISLTESGDTTPDGYVRAVWLSQFDLHPLYRDGGKQRDKADFRTLIEQLCRTLVRDGFDTVFLQLRPNGDSLYESEVYPLSKYVAGVYGGSIDYDAVGVVVEAAREYGLSVHGWINPFRLVTPEEMALIPTGYAVRDWYDAKSGQVKEWEDRLYLDPSYPEVRELIAEGAAEILQKYDLDGIHLDDYFYPTTDEGFDRAEFLQSGQADLGDFRRSNIDKTISLLYQTVHTFGADKLFGVAPAGNLYSLANGCYADARKWGSEDGYVDYLLPQLYFGFENAYCPFETILADWEDAVSNPNVRLWVGLDAAKAYLGTQGELDTFAGTEAGQTEWIRRKDVLSRSLKILYGEKRVSGYCFYSYAFLYDRFTGEVAEEILEAYDLFAPLLKEGPTTWYTAARPSVPSRERIPNASSTRTALYA